MVSFPVLLLACSVGAAWGDGPPRIDEGDEVVVRIMPPAPEEEEFFFSLRCEGHQEVFWAWSTSIPEYAVDIEPEEQENDDYPFASTLTVRDPQTTDTGFYRCHYAGASDLVTDAQNVASIYVFVHEEGKIFVNASITSVRVSTRQKLVLGCRTTLPSAAITLTKNHEEITPHAVWDPKIGFVLRSLTVHDTGFYQCLSETTDDIQMFSVEVTSGSLTLQTPNIDEGPDPHYVVDQPFSLNCTLVEENFHVALHWSYPAAGVMHQISTGTYNEGSTTFIVSTLLVKKASKRDSGTYTCTATAQGYDSSSDYLDIEVQDELQPYVKIVSLSKITVNQSDTLRWKAEVFSFPGDPRIQYTNWRGQVLTDSDKIKLDFQPEKAFSWLTIYNITGSDFGQYTLKATTRDGTASSNATVSIEVKSAPSVVVEDVPPYLPPGSVLPITCTAQGFPLPSVEWKFQTCPSGRPSCSPFQDIRVVEVSLKTLAPGNLIRSNTSLTLTSSGFLRCLSVNSLGTVNHTVPVALSDIGGLHVLRHTGLNITTNITTSSRLSVITNDDFLLTCGANKLHYKAVMLHTPLRNEDEVREVRSEYSWVREVAAQGVTKALHGKYSCVAQRHDNTTDIKSLTITVLEEAKVTFLKDSNMVKNATVIVKENAPFSLNCTVAGTPQPIVTWRKDGKPLSPDSKFFDGKTALLSNDLQRLELKYVFRERHVGAYTCTAENRVNRITGRLTVTVPAAGISTGAKVGLAVTVVGIAVLVIIVVILVNRVKTERKFRKSFRANELYLFEKGNIGQLNPDCAVDEQAELLPYGQEWEVPRERITLGKQLGSGAFGRVVKASVTGLEGPAATSVAIKMCKSQVDPSQVRALTLELKIMIHLGQHLNIVNLMGANTVHVGKGELWILVEYCRFGNLLVFMHRHRRNFINQIDPTTGRIDITKMTPDSASLLHPLSPGASWRHTNSRGSHDGFSGAPISPIALADPPLGRHASSPQRQTSGTPQVHNPLYSAAMLSPGGGGSLGPHTTDDAATSDVEFCGSDGKTQCTTTSSMESDARVQNTYYTSTLGSNASHAPLSPSETGLLDSHGNAFVHEVGSVPGVNTPFTTSDLVCWAWQVAHGMDYLASRKVLHGDLAARNLLLADDNVVKISDFGLSREMYKKDVYMKKSDDLMPVKWISVEAIRDRIFSVQSDVWAFGVTLWEIFSLGSTPYPGIEVNKDFLQLLEDGYRMSCPKYANQEIYQLLLECWETEPRDRPSFSEAFHRLDSLMQPDVRGEYLSMNDQYMRMNEERFKDQPDYLNMLTPPDYENMTNKTKEDDDLTPHYVNMEVAGGGRRNTTGQVDIQSPEVVSYSNTRTTSSGPTPPGNHYLPMDCTRRSPSTEDDVFNPPPSEPPRFTFPHEGENTSPAGVPNEHDKPFLEDVDVKDKMLDIEQTTLITNGPQNT